MLGLSLRRLQTPTAYAFAVLARGGSEGGSTADVAADVTEDEWVMVEAPSAPRKSALTKTRETSGGACRALTFDD